MLSTNLERIEILIRQILLRVPREELAEVIIFGSAAFILLGKDLKRKIDDLDLFASEDSYSRLMHRGSEVEKKRGIYALDIGIPNVEIFKDFPGVRHGDVLLRAAATSQSHGLLVAAFEDLISWKRAQGRPKDFEDLRAMGIS